MAEDIDYIGIFRSLTDVQLADAQARLLAEFSDPYTSISTSGMSSSRDRRQIATELAACSQVIKERKSTTPRNRVRASFR